jgi:hypothetical protein
VRREHVAVDQRPKSPRKDKFAGTELQRLGEQPDLRLQKPVELASIADSRVTDEGCAAAALAERMRAAPRAVSAKRRSASRRGNEGKFPIIAFSRGASLRNPKAKQRSSDLCQCIRKFPGPEAGFE